MLKSESIVFQLKRSSYQNASHVLNTARSRELDAVQKNRHFSS